ncbi:hypothetical protein GYMLUDRAFT_257739 [Collybiopsis luxurians FD-317 M1]|nr:hypothetical protein GYMLUDRAFT_257739 [Collybiopsis luxurians FD-317 M1]
MTFNPQVTVNDTDAKLIEQSLNDIFSGFVIGTVLFGVVLVEGYCYFQSYKDDSVRQKSFSKASEKARVWLSSYGVKRNHPSLVDMAGGIFLSDSYMYLIKGTTSASRATLICSTMHRYCGCFSGLWSNACCLITQAVLIEISRTGPSVQHNAGDSKASPLSELRRFKSESLISDLFQWVVDLGFIVCGAMDVMITAIMVFLLRSNATALLFTRNIHIRSRTDGIEDEKSFLTGLAGHARDKSLTAIAYIILEAVKPQAIFYLGIFNSRIYTISFLSLLNIRGKLRDDLDATVPLEIHFASVPKTATSPASPLSSSTNTSNIPTHNSTPPRTHFEFQEKSVDSNF